MRGIDIDNREIASVDVLETDKHLNTRQDKATNPVAEVADCTHSFRHCSSVIPMRCDRTAEDKITGRKKIKECVTMHCGDCKAQ